MLVCHAPTYKLFFEKLVYAGIILVLYMLPGHSFYFQNIVFKKKTITLTTKTTQDLNN